MFGPSLAHNNMMRKPNIFDDMDGDAGSSPLKLTMKSGNRKQKLFKEEKGQDKGIKDKKNNFNIFKSNTPKGTFQTAKKQDKKQPGDNLKLEDANNKQMRGSGVNIREKNFWSKQFSKYCDELEDLMGQTRDAVAGTNYEQESKQCFDSLAHGIDHKFMLVKPICIAQSKYVVMLWNDRYQDDVNSHIRIYAIDQMNKSKYPIEPKDKLSPANRDSVSKRQNSSQRIDEFEKGNFTPQQNMNFLGFFNAEAIINTSKYISTRAVLSNLTIDGLIICNYCISANDSLLAVIFTNAGNNEIFARVYALPSMAVLLESEPMPESWVSYNTFNPFFSYNNSFGADIHPEHLFITMKGALYFIDLSSMAHDDIGKLKPLVMIQSDQNLIEDLQKLTNLEHISHRDAIVGKLAETKSTVEYGLWKWDKMRGHGYARHKNHRLSVNNKYTLVTDSLTPDLKFIFAYHRHGKEVARINMKHSGSKVIFKYIMESKTIQRALVLDGGRYIIIADSAQEVRIYRRFGKTYQSIYCQYMLESIESLHIATNYKHLIVLTTKKLLSIRVHLSQAIDYDYFGKKKDLDKICSIYMSKNRRVVRFMDTHLEKVTTYIDDVEGIRSEVAETGINTTDKHTILIPNSDQIVVWSKTRVWIINNSGHAYSTIEEGSYRQHVTTASDDKFIASIFYTVKDDGAAIKDVKMNLDNNYLMIYLGNADDQLLRTIEVWSLLGSQNIFNLDDIDFEYCILREHQLMLRWKQYDLSTIEHGYYDNGQLYFDQITLGKKSYSKLLWVKAFSTLGRISKLIFVTCRKIYILDVSSMVVFSRKVSVYLENVQCEISPDGRMIAINERGYRSIMVYSIEPNEDNHFDNGFQISNNFVETLRFVFSHDSEYVATLDEEFMIKIISIKLKKEISEICIKDRLANPAIDVSHMIFTENSYHLAICFRSDMKHATRPEGFLVMTIPFYSTRFSPLDSILGYYIQRYFYSTHQLEKTVLCKSVVNIVHSFEHYQVAINSVFTAMILLINSPNLIETYCGNMIDFNLLCVHGLLKHSMERNKFYALMSYNNLFASYAAKTRETPYIDEEQIETLSKLEKSKMNNRYSRAVLSQVVFSFIRSEFGELKNEGNNVMPLALNYKPYQVEEAITTLMKSDFATLNKYHCYITQIPMDLSTGSEFSIAFFSNICNYTEEEIQTKYKSFIYYKWNKVYYFALAHASLYWIYNIFVYLYLGKYVDALWMAIILLILNGVFIIYEIKCCKASTRHYFQDAWNQVDFFNHLGNLGIVISMIVIDEDQSVLVINLLRFISTLMIGIRGISLLVVFKPTRYITTMFFQVLIEMWPFLVVLIYMIFVSTQAWSIEPQIEQLKVPEFSFLEALNVVINTSMGNFNTETSNGDRMTNLQLILIILVNVVLGLAMLNFLIALISEIYQKISDKRDYYDVLELLPIIQQIDLMFKKRRIVTKKLKAGEVHQMNDFDDPYNLNIGASQPPTPHMQSKIVEKLSIKKDLAQQEIANDFTEKLSINPMQSKKKPILSIKYKGNSCHYLTIIPEIEQSDQMKDLKQSVHASVREIAQQISENTTEMNTKTDKLRFNMRELQSSHVELKVMLQSILSTQESLTRRLDFATKGKTSSNISLPDDIEDLDKTGNLNATIANMTRVIKDQSDDSESIGSDEENDLFIQNNLVNG